jgi:hypothetical protein
MEGERGRIYENLYPEQRISYQRAKSDPVCPPRVSYKSDILPSEVLYLIGSTTTAVPYARTSVTPCMTSVAS